MEKTFNINWDDLDEVARLYNRAKSRFFELKRIATGTPSKKQRNLEVFSACQNIWYSDISHIYSSLPLDDNRVYYVYVHLDTSRTIAAGLNGVSTFAATLGMKHLPFYVGKGTGNRSHDLCRNETHSKVRQRLSKLGKAPLPFRLEERLTESEALACEAKLIDIFGLVANGGKLCNLDEGFLPDERRKCYLVDYRKICRLNIPLTNTHVDGAVSVDKTRVVPASST